MGHCGLPVRNAVNCCGCLWEPLISLISCVSGDCLGFPSFHQHPVSPRNPWSILLGLPRRFAPEVREKESPVKTIGWAGLFPQQKLSVPHSMALYEKGVNPSKGKKRGQGESTPESGVSPFKQKGITCFSGGKRGDSTNKGEAKKCFFVSSWCQARYLN